MLSAIRKKFNKDAENFQSAGSSNGMTTKNAPISIIDPSLRRKFANGVQYNLKILIKGDRNVGKTCLFLRLQGKSFVDNYNATEEIQATSIQWNYRATDDVIKVDVWDVVDQSRIKRKRVDGLKTNNQAYEFEEAALDAQFIDVYKGAHGVLLMFDVTKAWTWEYVQRELVQIPNHLPVLILANRIDMRHHRQVTREQAMHYAEIIDRGPNGARVRYAETSMRNGFGLKLIYLFFNIPFLILQKETLQKQLETNLRETDLSFEEMDAYLESDDNDYEKFSQNLNERRRKEAEKLAPKATSDLSPNSLKKSIVDSTNQANAHKIDNPKSPCDNVIVQNKSRDVSDVKREPENKSIEKEDHDVTQFYADTQKDINIKTSSLQRPRVLKLHDDSDSEHEQGNSMVIRHEDDIESLDSQDERIVVNKKCDLPNSSNVIITPMAYEIPPMISKVVEAKNKSMKNNCKLEQSSTPPPAEPTTSSTLTAEDLENWFGNDDEIVVNDPKPTLQKAKLQQFNNDEEEEDYPSLNPLVSHIAEDSLDSDTEILSSTSKTSSASCKEKRTKSSKKMHEAQPKVFHYDSSLSQANPKKKKGKKEANSDENGTKVEKPKKKATGRKKEVLTYATTNVNSEKQDTASYEEL